MAGHVGIGRIVSEESGGATLLFDGEHEVSFVSMTFIRAPAITAVSPQGEVLSTLYLKHSLHSSLLAVPCGPSGSFRSGNPTPTARGNLVSA